MPNEEQTTARFGALPRNDQDRPTVKVLEPEVARATLARGGSVRWLVGGVPTRVSLERDGAVELTLDHDVLDTMYVCDGCGACRATDETCRCGSTDEAPLISDLFEVCTDRAWVREMRTDLDPLLGTTLLALNTDFGVTVSPARCGCPALCGCKRPAVREGDEGEFTCASCAKWQGCEACNGIHCPDAPCSLLSA